MYNISDLESQLQNRLKRRGFNDVDEIDVQEEIERAIRVINRCRRFQSTKDKPYDIKYEDLIVPLATTAFAKIGAEGEISHSENGIVRTYTSGGDYPKDMLEEIIPLIK